MRSHHGILCKFCRAHRTYALYAEFKYFFPRCWCCGSEDHPLMDCIRDENTGSVTFSCLCPIIDTKELNLIDVSVNNAKDWLTPGKIAENCGFQLTAVNDLIEQLTEYGCGKYLFPVDLGKLKEESLQVCEIERSSWTFTKTNRVNVLLDDDESINSREG